METRKFGSTDMMVHVVGLGGAEIGFGGTPQAEVDLMLNEMLDTGINVIDTGECYKDSEEKIGKAVSHRRNDFYLFTKLGHSSGFPEPDWDLGMLRKSVDRSLERLQTETIDLLQIHSCTLDILQKGEVIEVIQEAKKQGKARYIGYSGDREEAVYAAGLGVFDAIQTSVSIAEQQPISTTLPIAKQRGVAVIAKRPIANAAWKHPSAEAAGYGGEYWKRLQRLGYKFDDMVSVALGFTLAQDIHLAIVGATGIGRWRTNKVYADQPRLEQAIIDQIRAKWLEVSEPDWVGQN